MGNTDLFQIVKYESRRSKLCVSRVGGVKRQMSFTAGGAAQWREGTVVPTRGLGSLSNGKPGVLLLQKNGVKYVHLKEKKKKKKPTGVWEVLPCSYSYVPGSGARLSGFESWLLCSLAMKPSANYVAAP